VDRTCPVWLKGDLGGHPFKVKLTRKGSVYTGTTKAKVTTCGETPGLEGMVPRYLTNTLTFRLTRGKGEGGLWTSWQGSLQMRQPRAEDPLNPLTYCPAASWRFSLRSK
jgi:hypothetical protein